MTQKLTVAAAVVGAPLLVGNACARLGGTTESMRLSRIESSAHVRDGSFQNLAFHGWAEPAERLWVAADGVELAVWQAGQSVEPSNPPALARWWPDGPWQSAEQAPVFASGLESIRGEGLVAQ